MMPHVIHMPELLTGMSDAVLMAWLVHPGQDITIGLPLAEIETDKALVEYEADVDGVLAECLVQPGDTVAVGAAIAVITTPDEPHTPAPLAESPPPSNASPDTTSATPDAHDGGDVAAGGIVTAALPTAAPAPPAVEQLARTPSASHTAVSRRFISPLVRRLADERGLDLGSVTGSGPNGRIVKHDILAMDQRPRDTTEMPPARESSSTSDSEPSSAPRPPSAPRAAALPRPTRPDGGEQFTDEPLTSMRRAIATRLTESKATIPHFYLQADCRVGNLLELRRSINEHAAVKVSVNDLIVKAAAAAMRVVPAVNASWAGDAIRRFHVVDIAVAVALEAGLITPVIRNVDRKSVTDVSRAVTDLAERGRSNQLKQHELEGGAFCVSNLGMYGTERLTAIINPPQSGILAVGAATERPVVADGEMIVATVMSVTLSADHRVYDGATGARWLAAFVDHVEHPMKILV